MKPGHRSTWWASASLNACTLVSLLMPLLFVLSGSAQDQKPNSQVIDQQYDQAITKARSLLTEKKNKEAVQESERAIKIDESRWEGYVLAASGYSAQQLHDDAIGYLQMALPRAPDDKKDKIRAALAESRAALAKSASAARASDSPATSQPAASPQLPAPTQAEVVLWKSIESSTRPEDFRGYLNSYPKGTYSGVAASRLDTLSWKSIENSTNPIDFKTYIAANPSGAYVTLAQEKIDSLEWAAVEKSTSEADLQHFAEQHKNSRFGETALEKADDLAWSVASARNTVDDYDNYLEHYPAGNHRRDAEKRRVNLLDQKAQREAADLQMQKRKQEVLEQAKREGEFVWVHGHNAGSVWGQGRYLSFNGVGTMQISTSGISWTEDPHKPGTNTEHNFKVPCQDVTWQRRKDGPIVLEEGDISMKIKGKKYSFSNGPHEVGNLYGTESFLMLIKQFCP